MALLAIVDWQISSRKTCWHVIWINVPVNSQHKLRHVQEWTLNKHYEMFISFLCTCHNVKHTAGFLCVCYWKYVPLAVISAFIRFSLNLSPWAFCSVLYLDILSFFEIMKKPRAWISFHLVKTKVMLKKWHHSFWLMSPILKPSFIEQKYHELLKLHHIRGFTTYAHVFCLIGPLWQRQAVERCYVNIFPQRPIWHLWSTWAVYGEQTDLFWSDETS